jgi:ethanolamine utilization protein EutQ (cupin superfamily)
MQEDLIMRLRQTVREMEAKMEEQKVMNEQKFKYLRQEVEVKRHQLENMRAMVECSEPSNNNIIVTNDLDNDQNKPVRVGGGFLVPSLAQFYNS